MTEIQFLAQFILDESIPSAIRQQFLDRIIELEKQRISPYIVNPPAQIFSPFNMPAIQCVCVYPNPWGSTTPPHCIKCGKQAANWITISGSPTAGATNNITTVANGLSLVKEK